MSDTKEPLLGTDNFEDKPNISVYKVRWFVLGNYLAFGLVLGIDINSFGPVNDVLSMYFETPPREIDFLLTMFWLSDFVSFLPFSVLSQALGYRKTYLLQQFGAAAGLILVAIAWSSRHWFISALVGQILVGVSTVLYAPLTVQTAATWFPANEVPIAVALPGVFLRAGCAIGGTAVTHLVNVHQSNAEVKERFLWYFGTMAAVTLVTSASALVFLKEKPPKPPGYAQAKVAHCLADRSATEALRDNLQLYWDLLRCRQFLVVFFSMMTVAACLDATIALLSSQLHAVFVHRTHLDVTGGHMALVLMACFVVGGFVCGLALSKFRNYKTSCISALICAILADVVVLIGFGTRSLMATGFGIGLRGLGIGAASTAQYELLREVTYPKAAISVGLLVSGFSAPLTFALITAQRALLRGGGAMATVGMSLTTLSVATVLLAIQKTDLRRTSVERQED